MISFGKTDKGKKRKRNEDAIFYSDHPIGCLTNLYIIADGMGGHKAGAFASDFAVHSFVDFVKKFNVTEQNKVPICIIDEGINYINNILHKKAEKDIHLYKMGTTFVVATIVENKLYIGNIGDSRLYIINHTIQRITKDHSLIEEMIHTGYITREQAKEHPDRHIITRAVGIENNVKADIFEIPLKNDDIVLMCSDGLTSMLDDQEIKNIIVNNKELEKSVNQLINMANEKGGNDNISVIVIKCHL